MGEEGEPSLIYGLELQVSVIHFLNRTIIQEK
jgi:hypothetical protein